MEHDPFLPFSVDYCSTLILLDLLVAYDAFPEIGQPIIILCPSFGGGEGFLKFNNHNRMLPHMDCSLSPDPQAPDRTQAAALQYDPVKDF